MAWLSLLGMYNYSPDLFDLLQLPDEINRDVFIQNLLAETAEQEVIYPDAEILKQVIGAWSASRLHAWEKIAAVTFAQNYDPFVNVSRDEVRTIETSGEQTGQVSAWDSSAFINRGKDIGTSTVTETFHVEGDSAINDSQDIIRKEADVRLKYDLFQIIINEFRNRFCLMIY